MYIHEYLAKDILRESGVALPRSVHVSELTAVESAYKQLSSEIVVVKAQVLSGARGKSGGIKVCSSLTEVHEACTQLLGSTLITPQNPDGLPVNSVLLEEGVAIERELYISITIDRALQTIGIIASTAGGGDIEAVAIQTPELILTRSVDIITGLEQSAVVTLANELAVSKDELSTLLHILYEIFTSKNCNLIEINPLVVSGGKLFPLDCKIEFDSNALFKHPDIANLRDESQEHAKDIQASRYGLNYISLGGEIACMVNGAGLAMATMDLIKHFGSTPANFLDVGGGTDSDKVAKAIGIIQSEPTVKAILINIFGGIVRCDLIAEGIIQALKDTGLSLPLVVRLEGTNAEQGLRLLEESGLNIVSEHDLAHAAHTAVMLAK